MGRPRALTCEQEREVCTRYEQMKRDKVSSAVIVLSDEYGVNAQTIYRVLERHGVKRRNRRPKKDQKHYESGCHTKYCNALIVILRRHTSMTHGEIVELTGYPSSVVGNITCRRCPDTKAIRKHKSEYDIEQMKHEYRELGMTSYELGEKYGVRSGTIRRWMRQEGICKGKDNGISNRKSHDAAVSRFVDNFSAEIEQCNTCRDRAYVRRKHRILSRPHDKGSDGIRWRDIAKRNGGDLTCWICGCKCMPGSSSHDMLPSVDHVIPIYAGGTDTFDNVRIAHVGCNRDRYISEVRANAQEQAAADQ